MGSTSGPNGLALIRTDRTAEAIEAFRYGKEDLLNEDERLLARYIRDVVHGRVRHLRRVGHVGGYAHGVGRSRGVEQEVLDILDEPSGR